MHNLALVRSVVTATITALLLVATSAQAGRSLQPGFYSHEPDGVGLRISNASSGEVCSDASGPATVCNAVSKIVITGQERCDWTDGQQYPCTRYGYQFDYAGATPGEAIQCQARRRSGADTQTMSYALDLGADRGSVFYPLWSTYSPVERRAIVTEVHECSYRGALLTTIEFLLYYEPGTPPPAGGGAVPANGIDEPLFEEIPNACGYLTEPTAKNLLRVDTVRPSAANEHIPTFWSQCIYSGKGVSGRSVSYVFKFMLYELYDVANLDPMQLDFNATFTGGGEAFVEKLTNLGKVAYVFLKKDRTTLMVVTGIQGPPQSDGRPSELVATYYLADPETPHEQRLEKLRAKAIEHLAEWHSQQ